MHGDPEDGPIDEAEIEGGGAPGSPTEDAALTDAIDEILAGATPPDIWSDEFIDSFSEGRSEDCDITLSLPSITFPDPTLGEIQGLDEAQATLNELDGLVGDIVNIVRSNLPDVVNGPLDDIFGPYTPPPPPLVPFPNPNPFPSPFPGPMPFPFGPGLQNDIYFRISQRIAEVLAKVALIRTSFDTQDATAASPRFSPTSDKIRIRVATDMEAAVRLYSQMDSTYTFGRGRGTSHGVNDTTVAPAASMGFDRPWFGKALILQSIVPEQFSVPYPMPASGGYWIAQFGVAGEMSALHSGIAKLTTLGHGLDIDVRFIGNYGRVRVLVIPPAPCQVVWGDFEVLGPYEDDLARREAARFAAIEGKRDAMALQISALQNTLGLIGTAAGVIPVVGALIDTLLGRLNIAFEDAKNSLIKGVNRANGAQRRINLTLAETYPERAPIGGAEDQSLP